VPIGRQSVKYRLVHTVGAIRTRIVAYPRASGPNALAIGPSSSIEKERRVQVLVRDNNVDQALKALKKEECSARASSAR
jgi:hypothetical protein